MRRALSSSASLFMLLVIACTQPPKKIKPFLWVKALPGDGRVSVQCWLNEETLLDHGGQFGHFKLLRSEGNGDFEEIAEFGPISPPRAAWCWTDSSVINTRSYRYLVHAIFAIFLDPEAEGYSDTFFVVPRTGLEDPRPPAPNSFNYKEPLVGDTVELFWTPPSNHDSLYYLFWSPDKDSFYLYAENFDAAGNDWKPDEDAIHPVRLEDPRFTFVHDRNGDIAYYRISSFVDSIISYPSKLLEIEHTWQP